MIVMSTSKGDIHIELDTENTPVTSENFLKYCHEGFYNGTIFHRVIGNFMIQGGGFNVDMEQKEVGEPIQNEAKKGKLNKRGSIAMARTSDPHSATAQFIINVVNNNFLDHSAESPQGFGYCVFGEVVKGMDVVDEISKLKTGSRKGHADVPVEEVVLIEVKEV